MLVFIPQENLIIKDVLGEGAFGSVYKALYQSNDGLEVRTVFFYFDCCVLSRFVNKCIDISYFFSCLSWVYLLGKK